MAIPQQLRAGDTITWTEDPVGEVSSDDWDLTVFLRFNKAAEGLTVTATTSGTGWACTISATTSGGMDAGTWYYQTRATKETEVVTLRAGQIEVLPSLAYSGTPSAFDNRSQTEIELAEVQAAIRAIVVRGAAQYTIGSRSFSSLDIGRLMERESKLKGIVAREKAAARLSAGLADGRDLYVRFS